MKLIPLPALSDNYIWMLHDGRQALVVDPGVAEPVLAALHAENLQLRAILVTHHHADHTGGIDTLRNSTGAAVYGPARETLPGPLTPLREADKVAVLGLQFTVLEVPGHTAGHIAYYCGEAHEAPLLFCGDTLFSGGCGRLFEGTPAQMLHSLERFAALPATTRVCCTHEYTLSNLKFALAVEPDNQDLAAYQRHCAGLRASGLPTLPSRIGLELKINPFLRSHLPALQAAARHHNASLTAQAGAFACLRQWKNDYR